MTDEKQPVYFTYKDRVFRLLFRDKHRLLELYNALNRTNYSDVDSLTTTTLENAIEYSRAVTPQIRQAGNRLSGLAETAYASLLA